MYNKEVVDIANWFGCFLWYNQDSCGTLANSFCNSDKASKSCKLIWSNGDDDALIHSRRQWDEAVATGNAYKALAVPWGLHNGTLQGFVEEVRRRGAWAVKQRRSYLLERRRTVESPDGDGFDSK